MKTIDLRKERKRQRREGYKETILHAAESLIVRKGYRATTMDDIARETQFSKATLYNYFRSKGDLTYEIMLHYFDDIKRSLADVQALDLAPVEKLKRTILTVLEVYDERENLSRAIMMDDSEHGIMKAFVAEHKGTSSPVEKKFIRTMKGKRREILEMGCAIVRDGIRCGAFREVDVPSAMNFLNAVLQGILHLRAWMDPKPKVREEAEMIFGFFMRGIEKEHAPLKGDSQ
ncbi:TetR/AcrR family transcriptional regulator [bacterium]|jgi:AcrR family transcriptional regulator|nr:MAG: TetR/AcrR family transcriptional regulator [bacterium]